MASGPDWIDTMSNFLWEQLETPPGTDNIVCKRQKRHSPMNNAYYCETCLWLVYPCSYPCLKRSRVRSCFMVFNRGFFLFLCFALNCKVLWADGVRESSGGRKTSGRVGGEGLLGGGGGLCIPLTLVIAALYPSSSLSWISVCAVSQFPI